MELEHEFDGLFRSLIIGGIIFLVAIYAFDRFGFFEIINGDPVLLSLVVFIALVWFGKMMLRGLIIHKGMGKKKQS